jgi:uncharacterized SAM-binding protein YcdF (DUF218 family)
MVQSFGSCSQRRRPLLRPEHRATATGRRGGGCPPAAAHRGPERGERSGALCGTALSAGKARFVIASGGALRKGPAETYAMAALLTAWGVPQEAIILETASRNTYENAINSKRLLEAHGLHQVLLVTSALHMPRALALFRALGIDAGPAPTDFEVVESGG